jgi:uncharacterized protein
MNNLDTPLNEAELERLDRFLLERIDEDAAASGDKDEGIIDISSLDGFFTAIVSGPVMLPPSSWLPAVWGDFEPAWEKESDFMDIMALMMRHMNGIAGMLMEQPEAFEPIFLERAAEGKTYLIVDEWCSGYVHGLSLAMDAWNTGGEEMTLLLMPILVYGSEKGWEFLKDMSESEQENLRDNIVPSVRAIHAWWQERREREMPVHAPVRRSSPDVGRNDPCPCGSGKKYKHCCLRSH